MPSRPCPVHGCPHLKPCPTHHQDRRKRSWSPNRDRKTHDRLRKQLIKERGNRCERCGTPTNKPVMHHIRYTPDIVQLLCPDCHKAVDDKAR